MSKLCISVLIAVVLALPSAASASPAAGRTVVAAIEKGLAAAPVWKSTRSDAAPGKRPPSIPTPRR